MAQMTGKERMMTAMRHGIPDRVPVSPDISNMIPCKLTGKPYWEVYIYKNPSLGDAYMDAVKLLGMDGWYIYGTVLGGNSAFPLEPDEVETIFYDVLVVPKELVTKKIVEQTEEKLVEQIIIETPYGEMEQTSVYFRSAPPWDVSNFVKDIEKDWPKLKWIFGESWHWAKEPTERDLIGDWGVYGIQVQSFFDFWDAVRNEFSERMILDFYDYPEKMREIFEFYRTFTIERTKAILAAGQPDRGVDEIVLQGSNTSMSLINPTLYREYALPLNQDVTRLCREAGVISHMHTCGKSNLVVQLNYEHTDLDVMEPLEKPPSGDVDLAEVKRKYGHRLALKGNLLTSGNLVHGTPADVEQEVIETLKAAAEGGGFILSSGDQVGGATPLDNLKAMIEAGWKYGEYTPDGRLAALS